MGSLASVSATAALLVTCPGRMIMASHNCASFPNAIILQMFLNVALAPTTVSVAQAPWVLARHTVPRQMATMSVAAHLATTPVQPMV